MPTSPNELMHVAIEIARPAADVLLSHYDRLSATQVQKKGNPRDLITIADQQSESIVIQGIIERFPDHAILAEEDGLIMPDGWPRKASGEPDGMPEYLWVIDPLDGTMNFARGFPAFAVSVGLLRRGIPIAGVVWAPRMAELFVAATGEGAWLLNPETDITKGVQSVGKRLSVSKRTTLPECLLATGFSYVRNKVTRNNVDNFSKLVLEAADIRRAGAASVDLCYVAAGRFDGYWEGYLKPWDVAAGAVIVAEAGGRITNFAGSDSPSDWIWNENLIATNVAIHDALKDRLSGVEPGYQPTLAHYAKGLL